MKLKNIQFEEVTIERNIDWLFEFTQDISERRRWDKQTKSIEFIEGFNKLEKGAKVYVESSEGVPMETIYLTFDPPNEISIQMLNRSYIFKNFIGSWNYISKTKNSTSLKITYQYDLRFPFSLFRKKISQRIKNNMKQKLQLLNNHLSNTSREANNIIEQ